MIQPAPVQPCVLIVDDDVFYRRAIKSYLGQEGYTLSEAVSGEEALELYKPGKYDVILLDLMMENLSGTDTLRTMRNRYPEDDTPIIVISGRDDKKTLIEAIGAGAIEYLTKPIDPTELMIRLKTLMRLRTLQRQVLERERILLQQKVLDNLTTTIAHYINNAATSILLMCEGQDFSTPDEWEHFRGIVEQQTQRIVRVVVALQRVKSLKERTVSYVGDIEMIDITSELQETIGLLEQQSEE
jgi:DNA-binding response OmpR family regulator